MMHLQVSCPSHGSLVLALFPTDAGLAPFALAFRAGLSGLPSEYDRPPFAGREEQANQWAHKVSPDESEVVLLPVEATRLYLDLRPFMNIAPLAVRYLPLLGTAAAASCC